MTNTPHKHAAIIKAWADGAKVECRISECYCWVNCEVPLWLESIQYRVKPERKSPGQVYFEGAYSSNWGVVSPNQKAIFEQGAKAVIKEYQKYGPW